MSNMSVFGGVQKIISRKHEDLSVYFLDSSTVRKSDNGDTKVTPEGSREGLGVASSRKPSPIDYWHKLYENTVFTTETFPTSERKKVSKDYADSQLRRYLELAENIHGGYDKAKELSRSGARKSRRGVR